MAKIENPDLPPEPAKKQSSLAFRMACYLLGLCITGNLMGHILPVPDYFRDKFEYFAEHKDEFDLLFFGASQTHWGISPIAFEDQLNRKGIELRTYNMGVPGSNGYEMDHLIRRVLDLEPANLRWAIIDWRPWTLEADKALQRRQIWWHSLTESIFLFRGLLYEPVGWSVRYKYFKIHFSDMFHKLTRMGTGPDFIEYLISRPGPGRGEWDYLGKHQGHEELNEANTDRFWIQGHGRRQKFLEQQEEYAEQTLEEAELVRALESRNTEEVDRYLEVLFPRILFSSQAQVDMLQSHGVFPIYIIPPSNEEHRLQRQLALEGFIPALFPFDDPFEYPELFTVENRYDDVHMNSWGAKIFAQRVADRFAELYQSQSGITDSDVPQ